MYPTALETIQVLRSFSGQLGEIWPTFLHKWHVLVSCHFGSYAGLAAGLFTAALTSYTSFMSYAMLMPDMEASVNDFADYPFSGIPGLRMSIDGATNTG